MKKVLCFSMLTCLVFGTVFAQQRPATPPPAPAPAQPAKPATPPPAQPAKPASPAPAKSASSGDAKNALGLDLFQMTKGFIASDSDLKLFYLITSINFEHLISPHWSIGAESDTYFMGFDGTPGFYFSLSGEGRYYPQSNNFEKFFVGTTIGFNALSFDGSSKPEDGGFFGLLASLKVGYKIIIGKLYLEPSMAYVLSKSSIASFLGVPTPLGWNGGLRFGFVF